MKVYTIGGYNEVGRNMSAVEVDNEVVIFDMGYNMDRIVMMEEEERNASYRELIKYSAIPDDYVLKGKNVVAIVPSHGHLDHIGAIPVMAERYNAPIITTPYTASLLREMFKEQAKEHLIKRLKALDYNHEIQVGKKGMRLEFIYVTHSIPHSSMVLLRTKEGNIAYLNDYKIDFSPVLKQEKPFPKRQFKKIGKEGIKVLIMESLRADEKSKTLSESIAKQMVKEVVKESYEETKGAVFITTFSSHIARINSIIEANKNERKIVMLGRSLDFYCKAAQEHNLLEIKNIPIYKRRKKVIETIKNIEKNKEEYLVILTGNQGEYDAVLTRMSRGEYPYAWGKEDVVIISSNPIPHPLNIANRFILERNLKEKGARVIDRIHVSGHGRREDARDIIRWLNPEFLIPSHGDLPKTSSLADLGREEGYIIGKTAIISYNGNVIKL